MKKYLTAIVCFLFALIIHAQVVGPKISAVEEVFDFGTIAPGSKVSHEFVIMNTGDAVLEIQKVRASCGCTAAKPDKDKLEPGDTTRIEVTFDTGKRKGNQKKYVYVFSNDKETPQLRLTFKAQIAKVGDEVSTSYNGPKLILNKNQHDFGKVKQGEIVSLNVYFKNAGQRLLKINNVKSSCGCTATVLDQKELAPGEDSMVNIKLDTSDRIGKFTRTVTLQTNDKLNPNQTITLFVNIEERNT